MLFVPPQHGKSELASRCMVAYALGQNPDLKIAATSYSIDLARSFNREIQRIIDSRAYGQIFPKTNLSSKRVASDHRGSYLRNTEEFEVVGKMGAYKAVGVMGGLSGRTVDLAIIDDPVKDAMEAGSTRYRDRVWDWYVNVLATRLHNDSKVVLIMTRWHEDDLAGRLLEKQPGKWKVVKIPAIKEEGRTSHPKDPRQPGEALWPGRHSKDKLMGIRELSIPAFESLYQQEPSTPGGNKIKEKWFQYCDEKELPGGLNWELWVDGAYTAKTENDPSGLMAAAFDPRLNRLYIRNAITDWWELPAILKRIPEFAYLNGLGARSRIRIEPKASGKSIKQMINANTVYSAVDHKSYLVQEGKEARVQAAAPKVEAGKVFLVRAPWNYEFIHQVTKFPNAAHDEFADLLGYACEYYFRPAKQSGRSPTNRRN